MHAYITPPDAQRIWIARRIGCDTFLTFQAPLVVLMVQPDRSHHLSRSLLVRFPASHVMTASYNIGTNSLGDPCVHDEVANLSFNPNQIACPHANALGK